MKEGEDLMIEGRMLCGRYRLIQRLGSGGMAEVWEAWSGDERIALKVWPGTWPVLSSLGSERTMPAGLRHPNIVSCREYHRDESGLVTMEMELVKGPSLADLADESGGVLPWSLIKPLMLQLCDALEHAHERGLVHRDLKPSNLLLDGDGRLKVIDFESAAIIGQGPHDPAKTIDMAASGTLPFMSPQQLNGANPSVADDLYSVGVTLYVLLAGLPPFHRGHVARQILKVTAPSVDQGQRRAGVLNPVPPGVARIIAACLSKNPRHRPASARELQRLLRQEKGTARGRRWLIKAMAGCAVGAPFGGASLLRDCGHHARDSEPGFTSVFDGRSLDRWSGNPRVWRVADGCIVGESQGAEDPGAGSGQRECLTWQCAVPDDFEFRCEVRLRLPSPDAGQLGVRYRIQERGAAQAYDLNFGADWRSCCGLWESGDPAALAMPGQIACRPAVPGPPAARLPGPLVAERDLQSAYRPNDWNTVVVRSVGHHLCHELNGVKVVDFVDDDPSRRHLSGGIGLNVVLRGGPRVEAGFRNLRIKAL